MKDASQPQSDGSSDAFAPLSVRIAAAVKMTGIGRSKLYELIKSGEIAIIKVGSSTLIPYDSLERFLDRQRGSSVASG